MSNSDVVENPSVEWVKETIAEPIANEHRMAGLLPDSGAIESDVRRMLERYDAEEREHGEAVHKSRPTERKRYKDPAAEEAQRQGVSFGRADGAPANHIAERMEIKTPRGAALYGRIRKMVERIPGTRFKQDEFKYPRLAHELLNEWDNYINRRRGYAEMSAPEASRKIGRFVEDLADRSVTILGPWRVGAI